MSKAAIISPPNKDLGGLKEEKKDGIISRLIDSLSKRHSTPESPPTTKPSATYYGVYIPCEIKKGSDEEVIHVYEKKTEALELVKRYKTARFKAFRNHQDAVSFALRGAEPIETHEGSCNSVFGEKPYPFKAPSPQDMVALRKSIEAGLTSSVRDRVWDNPRYLVSSGNTPAIVQEGSRYNALHVAAKSLNAEICNFILTTVGNPSFVQTLYGGDADTEACKEFAGILMDRYLNTPDKAMNETPLHFAAKYGAEHVVDVLTSFPQCNKLARNKYGETAKDVICSRAADDRKECSDRVRALLEERYYVPVLHSDDGSSPPTIGSVFTPARPPELNPDPMSPRLEILAFAGPMPQAQADVFRRRWKTPPRSARPAVPSFRLRDLAKGLETVGRNLAEEMKIGWKEYWPFLDTFTNLRSAEGLALLETYLKNKYESACSFAYSDSCHQSFNSPEELSISGITLNLSHQSPMTDALSPMSELCVAMTTCKITDRASHFRKTDPVRQRLCRQPNAKPLQINGDSTPTNHTVSQLLCIERTCLVFAKRIADALVFSLTAEPEIAGESLKSEAKHLQHTIYTYMDDERFQAINFALIHSRLAQLVVFKLKQQTKEADDINNLIEFLINLRCPNDDIFSSDDERKPFSYRTNRVKTSHVIDGHVRCLASFLSEELSEMDFSKSPATSEAQCTEIWEKASKCHCEWKIETFDRNSKKNASFRKNRSILSTSPKNDSLIRRLSFDQDIGDGKLHAREMDKPLSVNSPGGDGASAPVAVAVDVAKCQVVEAQISEDESQGSESDEEAYLTASEHSDESQHGDDDMQDASDRALAEPFIYGEEPSKMDRLVFDALAGCSISADTHPSVFRWRHCVALYSPAERESWLPAANTEESRCSVRWAPEDSAQTPHSMHSPHSTYSPHILHSPHTLHSPHMHSPHMHSPHMHSPHMHSPLSMASPHSPHSPQSPRGRLRLRARCSTPNRDTREDASRTLPLQVSTWLRVTGPNSPRSALATKNVSHNVSFGF